MSSTWSPDCLPDLRGTIVIITGGHSGLGLATSQELAMRGCKVYIASRSPEKANEAIVEIKKYIPRGSGGDVKFLQCDLSDFSSVKRAAEEFSRRETKLHILINNAGIMCTPYEETVDGFEAQWQTNYLSHFFLTSLLLPALLYTAREEERWVRVVNVTSDGHSMLAPRSGIHFEDMNLKGASVWKRYGHSKLAQVLHSKELARRYGEKGVMSVCVHPGTVKTGLSKGPLGSSWWYRIVKPLVERGAPGPRVGCWNTIWCAASEALEGDGNGGYYKPVGEKSKASKCGENEEMAENLWTWSDSRLKQFIRRKP